VESERYARIIRLPMVGDKGFKKLRSAKIALVGCGTLGGAYAINLARLGVGYLRLVDRDVVEEHNLSTQILYNENDLKSLHPKAVAAKQHLEAISSQGRFEARAADLTSFNAEELLSDVDLIIDATDNFEARFLVNDTAVKLGIPWIYTGVVGFSGVCMAVVPGKTPCLECVLEKAPGIGELPTCETTGVWASAAQAIVAVGLTESLRLFTGKRPGFGLSEIDFETGRWTKIYPERRVDCPACVKKEFSYLTGRATAGAARLCGRNMVHLSPDKTQQLNLPDLAKKLSFKFDVKASSDLLYMETPEAEIYLFPDGRAFVKGVEDLARARSLFNRYITA
jgi:adenylyltransferase/sulfurtransferase